ncbi:MAG: VWA domain-containing protein [Lachnospiraceae bacterium]|nr:VWA domain-containing protein [Lachnospiraceae bacterium]
MGDFWDGFEFPTLDPQTTTSASVNTVIEETPTIGDIAGSIIKRAMVVFFIIDISGSMKGARIGAVNDAIRNLLPELKKREASNTNAEIRIAIMEFSSNANWRTLTPQPIKNFVYDDITYVSGGTNFGNAFKALNEKLSRKAFLNASAGSYTPLIILLTDGKPSDIALYPEELDKLRHNSWFQYATKAGIAIEEGALSPECKQVLLEFTGNAKNVLEAKDTNVLSKQIELVTLTGVDFVTQQGSLQNANAGVQPAIGNKFGSTVVLPQPAFVNMNQGMMGTPTPVPVSLPQPQPAPIPNPIPQPTVNVTDGSDPVIPGLADIDWDNDFPTFN